MIVIRCVINSAPLNDNKSIFKSQTMKRKKTDSYHSQRKGKMKKFYFAFKASSEARILFLKLFREKECRDFPAEFNNQIHSYILYFVFSEEIHFWIPANAKR